MVYTVWLCRTSDFRSCMSGRFVDEDHQVFGGSGGRLHVNDEHLNALDESWCWIDEYTVRELSNEHQIIIFILLFVFLFLFIFCGAWYGRLDIEKQHLEFFGDSCIFEGCHFDNITRKGAAIKNSHAQPTGRMHNHHWKVIICHLEYAACTRGAREMEWYGRSSRT